MDLGRIVRGFVSNKEFEMLNIDSFLERYRTKYGRAKLARMTVYTFWYKGQEVGVVDYKLPASLESLSDKIIDSYFSIFKKYLNPIVARHLSFDAPNCLKVFRYHSIGQNGFFGVSEIKRRKSVLYDYEIALCFPEFFQLLQEKNTST
jgi:hypothetical protein